MKALILAAGLGSRLAPITDNCPKSLVKVNGKPILMKQIENLHENGITDITVVSGYKAEILENEVHRLYPEIRIIRSVDYASTNNMYSAYLAKEAINGEAFLMMNADVFYDASVIEKLLECPYENAIVTDIGNYLEETMKVVESRMGTDGHALALRGLGGAKHDGRIARVKAAGHVGRRDDVEHRVIVPHGPGAERVAHVAVQIDLHATTPEPAAPAASPCGRPACICRFRLSAPGPSSDCPKA